MNKQLRATDETPTGHNATPAGVTSTESKADAKARYAITPKGGGDVHHVHSIHTAHALHSRGDKVEDTKNGGDPFAEPAAKRG